MYGEAAAAAGFSGSIDTPVGSVYNALPAIPAGIASEEDES